MIFENNNSIQMIGFIEQTESVCVGIEAVVARAIEETQSMVLEGVHVVPGFLDHSRWREALVLEFVLSVSDADHHRTHFTVREFDSTQDVFPIAADWAQANGVATRLRPPSHH